MKFHPQWDVPDADRVRAYIETNFENEAQKADMEDALALTAMYSHSILGEDPEDADLEEGHLSPELRDFFRTANITGNPIERGLKGAMVIQKHDQEWMEGVLETYGKETLQKIVNNTIQEVQEVWESGRGGESHGGNWFGGMSVDTPLRMSERDKVEVKKAASVLKKHSSFNLDSRSPKSVQDDWGDEDRPEVGVPDDFSSSDALDMADEDLFDYLFMMKGIRYWETYKKIPPKNNWLVLIDDSGSMNNTKKLSWVLGLLSIITEDVLKNKSCAYIAMFEKDLSPFWKLDSLESITDFMSKFQGGRGGNTDIQGALQNVAGQLKDGFLIGQGDEMLIVEGSMEIFLLNDGEDPIDYDFEPTAKSHSLMLFEYNKNLANAAARSGGNAFYADQNGLTPVTNANRALLAPMLF